MEKRITAIIVLIIFSFSGCAVSSPSDQRKQEEINHQDQTTEENEKNEVKSEEPEETSSTDLTDTEETKDYVLPQNIWAIAGMSAEEQIISYKEENIDNKYFKNVEVNDEQALVLTMTEKQKELYKDKVKLIINENIVEAEKKEDIRIEISENYDEARMILGEKTSSAGVQVTFVKLVTQIGIYQIIDGCEPEEWGIHLEMERKEKTILDVNVPKDNWRISSEELGG